MRSRTAGASITRPSSPSSAPNVPNPIACARICTIFGIRMVPRKQPAAITRNDSPGMSEKARSHAGPLSRLGKGRSHPPSHSVTAMDDTASIAAYSARKNSDQRNPLYSVWKPATSSDSASGRSKGARFVSNHRDRKHHERQKSQWEELKNEPHALRLLRLDDTDHAQRAGAGLQARHQHRAHNR